MQNPEKLTEKPLNDSIKQKIGPQKFDNIR